MVGGISKVWRISQEGNRLQFFKYVTFKHYEKCLLMLQRGFGSSIPSVLLGYLKKMSVLIITLLNIFSTIALH